MRISCPNASGALEPPFPVPQWYRARGVLSSQLGKQRDIRAKRDRRRPKHGNISAGVEIAPALRKEAIDTSTSGSEEQEAAFGTALGCGNAIDRAPVYWPRVMISPMDVQSYSAILRRK
jgi:hypothetical protein